MDVNKLAAQLANDPNLLIVEKDNLTRFTDCNGKWLRYASLKDKDTVLGLTDKECAWAEFAAQYEKDDLDILSGKAYGIVHPCTVEDRRFCWIHCYKWPKYDDTGKPSGLNVIAYEVSDRNTLDALFLLTNRNKFGVKQYSVDKPTDEHLTNREKEVLFCLCYGMPAKRVASCMNRSKRTIEIHIDHIKSKFHCHNKEQIIEYAASKGYVSILPGYLLEPSAPKASGFTDLCQFVTTALNSNPPNLHKFPNLSQNM